MHTIRSQSVLLAAAFAALQGCGGSSNVGAAPAAPGPRETAPSATATAAPATAKEDARLAELKVIAEDAYIYALPLILMDLTARFTTAVTKADDSRAPLNQLARASRFPEPDNKQVVSMNLDTLYVQGFLDVSEEPMLVTVPAAGKRYYLLPLLDAWTDVFASPGTRTTGNGKLTFAVVGPGWAGKLPAGVKEYRSSTGLVWLLGRAQTNGKADYPAVTAFEKGITLARLGPSGKAAEVTAGMPPAPVDAGTPPVLQAKRLTPEAFFARASELLVKNPPRPADAPALKRFEAIGFAPGKPFDAVKADPVLAAALEGVNERSLARMKKEGNDMVATKNGWRTYIGAGEFGTDYMKRAVLALYGLGANLNADALYPRTEVDGDGEPLTGDKAYVLHFEKGELPAVNAFWSLTMYDAEQFLVPNPIGRYALGDRDKLVYGKDGSLDIFIQHASPGKDREANWLPAPKGPFNLILRMYWPKPQVLDAKYAPPPVKVAK